MQNYKETPSYYGNEEFFNKYLGSSSYYRGLQTVMAKLVNITNSKNVLELGSALGTTSCYVQQSNPSVKVTGVDFRDDIVNKANELHGSENVHFITGDMTEVATQNLSSYDFIFMLYSFHHIEDPYWNKEQFLANMYKNMRDGAYLVIGETFLPEKCESDQLDQHILDLWELRAHEGENSTFWNTLSSLSSNSIEEATKASHTSFDEETHAGDLVFMRKGEYLVKVSWLVEAAEKAGFKVVINKPTNAVGESVLVLQK